MKQATSQAIGGTPMPLKRSKPILVQCKATTSSGERCKAKPHKDGFCFFHCDPKKAAELGRKGGKDNRHIYETPRGVTAPESDGDVTRTLAQTMAEVRTGKLESKISRTQSRPLSSQLRVTPIRPILEESPRTFLLDLSRGGTADLGQAVGQRPHVFGFAVRPEHEPVFVPAGARCLAES
jgi:general stress protein YciG